MLLDAKADMLIFGMGEKPVWEVADRLRRGESIRAIRDVRGTAFRLGAFIWIFIHGAFCLLGARLFRVDVHSVAIASAANIGAAASAPIVAAFQRPSLVPVSILMALVGYALGNYLAPLTGHLARLAAGQ
jgi:uncharacterized membrane protein